MHSPRSILLAAVLAQAGAWAQSSSPAAQHADRAAEFIQYGDLKSAEAELKQAVNLSPADPELLTSLGGVLGMEGRLQQANVYLAKAVQLKPQDPLLLRNLAGNEWQLGKFAQARRRLERLLSANPQDKGAIFLMGMVCENQKDYRRSIALLSSIPEVVESQPEALVALASSYFHTEHRSDALAALHKLSGQQVKPPVMFMAARVAMDAREYELAESLLRPIVTTHTDQAAVASNLALAQYRRGKIDESEKTMRTAFDAGQVNRESYLLLSKILADRGDFVAAHRYATEAARKYPDSAAVLSTKGAMEMKLQFFSAAVATLTKVSALHPSSSAERELALAEWRAGNREPAITRFEGALRRYPKDAETYQTFGTLLIEDASPESRTRAITLFQKALALDGNAVEAHFQLANLDLADGRLSEAQAHLAAALRTAANDSRLHFTLSRVYRRRGRDADADREMEEYRRLKK